MPDVLNVVATLICISITLFLILKVAHHWMKVTYNCFARSIIFRNTTRYNEIYIDWDILSPNFLMIFLCLLWELNSGLHFSVSKAANLPESDMVLTTIHLLLPTNKCVWMSISAMRCATSRALFEMFHEKRNVHKIIIVLGGWVELVEIAPHRT